MRLFTSLKYYPPEIRDGRVRLQSKRFGDYIYVDNCKYVDKDTNTVYFANSDSILIKASNELVVAAE